jgi:predicted AlkP superfamily phosphohydrolase/phosphomutase
VTRRPCPHARHPRAARLAAVLALALLPAAALAYVGPGAGFALLGSFFGLLAALVAGAASLLVWPFRWVIRSWRRRKALAGARVKRVVIIGLDGLDPALAERWIASGDLPNLARLAREGSFSRLRTTYPSISPVAWSSFMTGVDPSRHNIFDFLDRDVRTYQPKLSSSAVSGPRRTLQVGSWIIPLGRPLVRNMRRSRAFWSILGDHGIACNILRVPLTFPPEKFAGAMLSAMCVPDLRGTQGSFTYYTTDPAEAGPTSAAPEATGGQRILVEVKEGEIAGSLAGPDNPLRADHRPVPLPFTLRLEKGGAVLRIEGRKYRLKEKEYSPWIQLTWRPAPGVRVHGIARFYVTRLEPTVGLYVTPINIDPGHPALPISWPTYYSVYLSKLIGEFATLGLAEDTWALNERVIDEAAFFQQTMDHHEEREKMFLNALAKSREGVVACVFDGTDRAQHMFYRYLEPDHPANRGKDTERFRDAIRDVYRRADATIGKATAALRPDDMLVVLSDHGFQSFRRGVNLNTWLLENGFLHLKDPARSCGDWFDNVDWSRTQAYAFGLGGIYVNEKGREADGIVAPGAEAAEVKRRIIAGLSGLVDAQTGAVAITDVFDTGRVHSRGPYQAAGLDLIVGYNRGYRASWEGATGRVTAQVFADNTKSWSGDHCVDPRLVPGVLFSNRPFRAEDPGIMDLAPTILTLFGVSPPAHMTGKTLEVALQPGP